MKRFLLATIATLALGTAAQAQTLAQRLIDAYQERGFTSIEVETEDGVIKVEATRDGVTREAFYDAETGEPIPRDGGDDGGDDGDDDDGDDDGDGNRGHGNDADGFDEDNPGRGHRDGNRGGGNGRGND